MTIQVTRPKTAFGNALRTRFRRRPDAAAVQLEESPDEEDLEKGSRDDDDAHDYRPRPDARVIARRAVPVLKDVAPGARLHHEDLVRSLVHHLQDFLY